MCLFRKKIVIPAIPAVESANCLIVTIKADNFHEYLELTHKFINKLRYAEKTKSYTIISINANKMKIQVLKLDSSSIVKFMFENPEKDDKKE